MHQQPISVAPDQFKSAAGTIRFRVLLVLSLLVLIAATLVFPFSMEGRLWGSIFDLAHAPVFCAAMLCCVGIADPAAIGLSPRRTTVLTMTARRVLLCAGILLILGIVCEYLQKFANRSPSFLDIVANTAGLLAGLIWIASQRCSPLAKWLLATAAVGVLIGVNVRPVQQIQDSVQQIRSFPLLGSFERTHELDGWTAHRAKLARSTGWASHQQHSMALTLLPAKYSGVSLLWFEPDWHSFRFLQLDIMNPNAEPLTLIVKLFDHEHAELGFDHADRFHQTVIVPPNSVNNVAIDLADVAAAPVNRPMNLRNMAAIDIFAVDIPSSTTCLIDNVRLVR